MPGLHDGNEKSIASFHTPKLKLQSFLREGSVPKSDNDTAADAARPIAELFSDTTVMFADIAGFTAWSSVSEPAQVFTLLETLYSAFDAIAKRRGVFKVETIGDSYVAVTGLPDPRKDHAVVMVRFARDCREKMIELTQKLEISLGPDTVEISYR
jgi:class 3 adenylate cyclase